MKKFSTLKLLYILIINRDISESSLPLHRASFFRRRSRTNLIQLKCVVLRELACWSGHSHWLSFCAVSLTSF